MFSPFTGEPITAPGRVLAVKIDNIVQARPPTGLTGADIVYVLPVEGGLSRILAVFSSHFPPVIGSVRSAREARDIGFLFGPAPAGGRPTRSFSVSYAAAKFAFAWSASAGRWLVSMNGKPARATEGGRLSAPTVVIQYTRVRTSRFLEAGSRPPCAGSTGSGAAVVRRDGDAYAARWSRHAPTAAQHLPRHPASRDVRPRPGVDRARRQQVEPGRSSLRLGPLASGNFPPAGRR